MSAIAARVAAAVEEQNAAVATIAEGVNRASSEARSGAEAMTRVAGASSDARTTADEVKALAEELAGDAEQLDAGGAAFPERSARGLSVDGPRRGPLRTGTRLRSCQSAQSVSVRLHLAGSSAVRLCEELFRIALDALYAFGEDDGWALASHIALSALLALFPFLIVLTALAGFFGSKDIADKLATLLLDTWPQEVADPLGARDPQRARHAPAAAC